jgi:poly-gamma-glutamate capsule biosynthesis protein CapA/YwtB (metallophosphatase superfamily)
MAWKIRIPIVFCLLLLAQPVLLPAGSEPLTLTAVGDIMMGSTGQRTVLPPGDGEGLFQEVSEYLRGGDLVFGNLEGTLSDGEEGGKCREDKGPWCFEFRTPIRYVRHLKENGFNVVNIANNHAWDFGPEGIGNTLEALQGAGIKAAGGAALAFFEIRGKRIVLVGFSYKASKYSYSILEIPQAVEIVKRLKANHDLVIFSFHGGAEGHSAQHVADRKEVFLGENRGNVVRFARSVVEAGADLVLGHGPHVLRAMEVYKGKLIAYSLGNFLTYGLFNLKGPSGISVILKVRLDMESGCFLDGQLVPVKLVNGGLPEIDPEGEGVRIVRRLSEGDLDSRHLTVDENGCLRVAAGTRTCASERNQAVGRR